MSKDMKLNENNASINVKNITYNNKKRNMSDSNLDSKEVDSYQNTSDNIVLNNNRSNSESNLTEQNAETIAKNKSWNKRLVFFGISCLVFAFGSMVITGKTSESFADTEIGQNAIETGVSNSIAAGAIISTDDSAKTPMDHTIEHTSTAEETEILVWDYAAEDGDYVQILVNGTPMGDGFMILNKPKVFTVPSVGEIQIKGIRDGGGGITYGVHYRLNGTSYFNSAPENEFNTYTLTR